MENRSHTAPAPAWTRADAGTAAPTQWAGEVAIGLDVFTGRRQG